MYLNNNCHGNFSGLHRVALSSTLSRSNWNLKMLLFLEGRKLEFPEKNPQSKEENQQQTQPTYEPKSANPLDVFQSDTILLSLIWLLSHYIKLILEEIQKKAHKILIIQSHFQTSHIAMISFVVCS